MLLKMNVSLHCGVKLMTSGTCDYAQNSIFIFLLDYQSHWIQFSRKLTLCDQYQASILAPSWKSGDDEDSSGSSGPKEHFRRLIAVGCTHMDDIGCHPGHAETVK